jgi:hypothetical protein
VTPVNEKIRTHLEGWIRHQREQHGERIAKELIRAYLDGVNDTLKIVGEFGAAMTSILHDALEGN